MEWIKKEYRLSDNPAEFDITHIVSSLETTYWGKGRRKEDTIKSWKNSLGFALFHDKKQIGFARAVTDKTVTSRICDIYLEPQYRGKGLGSWMMKCILKHPDIARTRKTLVTKDAHGFYERLGFKKTEELSKEPEST